MKRRDGKKMFGMTKVTEDEIRNAIIKIMDREEAKIDEEMKTVTPHVFSEEFEKKMEAIMRVEKRKTKRCNAVRYVAASIVTVLLVGGLVFVGNEEARASKVGVEIQEWLDNFFVVEEKSKEDNGVLFEESQIGYIPEGFEKVEESVLFSKVYYKFQNNAGDYVILQVYRDKTAVGSDNEEIKQEVDLNTAGFEYRYVFKSDSNENVITWIDKDDVYYYLAGTIDKTEVINIMNGISY